MHDKLYCLIDYVKLNCMINYTALIHDTLYTLYCVDA
jgi:hypothetical protein